MSESTRDLVVKIGVLLLTLSLAAIVGYCGMRWGFWGGFGAFLGVQVFAYIFGKGAR